MLHCCQKVEGRYRHLTYQKSPHIATIIHVQNRHFFFKSPHFLGKNPHFLFEKSDNCVKKKLKSLTRPFLYDNYPQNKELGLEKVKFMFFLQKTQKKSPLDLKNHHGGHKSPLLATMLKKFFICKQNIYLFGQSECTVRWRC